MKKIDKAIYLLLRLLFYFFGKISFKTGKQLGNILGGIWFFLDKKHRKIKSEPIDRLVRQNREKLGVIVYPLHKAFEGVNKTLKNGMHSGFNPPPPAGNPPNRPRHAFATLADTPKRP